MKSVKARPKRIYKQFVTSKRSKNFSVVRSDGTIYNNERLRWPSSSLGTFRHNKENNE